MKADTAVDGPPHVSMTSEPTGEPVPRSPAPREADFRLLYEASPSLAIVVDPTGALPVIAATDGMVCALAAPREDVVGVPFGELFSAAPEHVAALRRVIQRRSPETTAPLPQEVATRPDQHEARWWSASYAPVFDRGGALAFVSVRFRARGEEHATDGSNGTDAPAALPRILVVDDDAALNAIVVKTLSPFYRVASAFDGLQALDTAAAFRPDLIICDLRLPALDGEDFVRELRRRSMFDSTAIVIITADEDRALRTRLLQAGAQDYLTKPFSIAELRARVGGLIALAAAERRGRTLTDELSARTVLERLREEWAAIIAHDLRQPVNAIVLAAAVLSKSLAGRESNLEKRSLERILGTARRMSGMVDDLLDVSNIEARRFVIERRQTSLGDLVTEALAGLPDERGRVQVDVDEHAAGASLWVDPGRIGQVLTNLLQNAIKYAHPGSLIRIAAAHTATAIDVTVANHGRGLRASDLTRIFERYVRTSEQGSVPGVGLGLYICRGIVEAHSGKIWAESGDGETRFRFTLPTAAPAAAIA